MKLLMLLFLVLIPTVFGRQGFGPTDQEWGYVTVREGAHMFWWLHYTTAAVDAYTDRPLIIWLQGGPGSSSTEYGNFEELGPIDTNLEPRNSTWVQHANIIFVDNPVGTGFGYVDELDFLTTNNTQIAKDFVVFLKGFYKELSKFEATPLYIFSESYGGKMTAEIAFYLDQAIRAGDIKSNFKGIGLGDSWISPVDSCLTWAPYLYNLGIIDTQQFNKLNEKALKLKDLVDNGKWTLATIAWEFLARIVASYSDNVNVYNVLTKIYSPGKSNNSKILNKEKAYLEIRYILGLMEQVQQALNLTQKWGVTNKKVFSYLRSDFMKPVTDVVERLLNETDIRVAVYNGQLDLIVDTPGTIHWVNRLTYKGSEEWSKASKKGFVMDNYYEGYEKQAGNLKFYWVLRAGHMVPSDNPNGMLYILKDVTDNFKV